MATQKTNGKYARNPRQINYRAREKVRKRLLAQAPPTCPLCGQPIDYGLDWYIDPKDGKRKRHPMSAEVDEIVPVSLGGSPIELSNLRIVHRICNQRRGNKMPPKAPPKGLPRSCAW